MSELKPEQRTALIEALENGYIFESRFFEVFTSTSMQILAQNWLKPEFSRRKNEREARFNITELGRLLAKECKRVDELERAVHVIGAFVKDRVDWVKK